MVKFKNGKRKNNVAISDCGDDDEDVKDGKITNNKQSVQIKMNLWPLALIGNSWLIQEF